MYSDVPLYLEQILAKYIIKYLIFLAAISATQVKYSANLVENLREINISELMTSLDAA